MQALRELREYLTLKNIAIFIMAITIFYYFSTTDDRQLEGYCNGMHSGFITGCKWEGGGYPAEHCEMEYEKFRPIDCPTQ